MKIYVASLSDYNNGYLHGAWIEATTDTEAMQAEINKVLRSSRYPNVHRQDFKCTNCQAEYTRTLDYGAKPWRVAAPIECTTCLEEGDNAQPVGEPYPSAEEWAIHDYDGAHPSSMGEYPGLENVAAWVELLEQAERAGIPDEVAAAVAENFSEPDKGGFAQTLDALTDDYAGKGNTLEDWCEEFEEEAGQLDEVPQRYRQYIDFESMARDMRLGGEVYEIRADGDVYVFWNR